MYRRIMVVVDGRPVSGCAAREGIALAQAHEAELVFYAVMPQIAATHCDLPSPASVAPPEAEQARRRAADELAGRLLALAERAGVMAIAVKGREEDGVAGIVAAARRRRCELIVAASAGHNAVMRLFVESLVPGLITVSPVPVLVCKEPGRTHDADDHGAAGSSRRSPARWRRRWR